MYTTSPQHRSRPLPQLGWLSLIALCLALLSLLCLSRQAWATPSIKMQVDRDTITMNDNLRLNITIQGGSALTRPHIPPKGNFDVVGQSSGNAIEIINGQMSVTNTFEYVLRPKAPGKFEIGPVETHIDGKTYSAGPIKVEVLKEQQNIPYQARPPSIITPGFPQRPNWPQQTPGFPQQQTPPQPQGAGADTFITAQVDKDEAYVGEQILYTFRLYSSVSLQNAQLKLPDFNEFVAEELIKERKFETDINGRRYAVNEWRLALFPTKAGRLKTGKASVEARVLVGGSRDPFNDPFFRMPLRQRWEDKTFRSKDLSIAVKDLPPAPDYFTGLVGEFTIVDQLDQSTAQTGETVNLTATISGQGNIRDARLQGPQDTPQLKVYPSTPSEDIKKSLQGIGGIKKFQFALVPSRPGTVKIGPLKTAFFNPTTGQYEDLVVPERTLTIRGAPTQESLVTAGIDEGEGLGPRSPTRRVLMGPRAPAALLAQQYPPAYLRYLAWALVLGLPLFYLLLVAWRRQQEKIIAQSEDRKRSSAFRRAKSSLQTIKENKEQDPSSALSQVMRNYLGDVFAIKGLALTPGEVENLLQEKGVPADRSRRMVYLLEQLDQWKYSGQGDIRQDLKTLKQEILDILREVEKVLSK